MKRVVIFASGSGSNAENIINYFENSEKISVVKVYCNKKEAGVYNRCIKLNKDCEWFSREDFSQKNTLLNKLVQETDFIILAGFLWKIPEPIVKAFPNKIINIHPALFNYFENSEKISVVKVYCNKKEAGVYNRCIKLNKDCEWFSREDFSQKNTLLNKLVKETDFIILAGFLWKIPEPIVKAFPNKIINIHPALLPKYGGKGMYGMHVHEAVKNNCDKETGITIHFVNERYDEGAIIFQAKTSLKITDSSKDIAQKIHDLEYEYFPKVIEKTILKNGS